MADTSYKLINEEILTDIADAIREKSEVSTTYYPHEMPDAIRDIETGEDLNLTVATVTSTEASQTVTPTQGYNGFSRVNVNPIPSQYKKLTTTTTATAENILNGKTVYNNNGQLVTGSMANNGSTSGTISTKEGTVTIPSGYTSGGTVSINSSEKAKIVDNNIKSGVTILGVSGKSSVVDTANSNAVAENILSNKTAFVNGTKVTGSMPNNGATGGTISTKTGTVTIPAGHTTGGTVSISTTEQEKIVAGNIKEGVTILGVTGTASGGGTPVLQEKTATPDTTTQQIRPDDNYDGLSKVTVNPIPSQYKPLTTTTTATVGNILNTKTAYNSDGQLITGNMANNGSTGGTINTKTGTVTIPEGYTSGGSVSISSTEQEKIIADNIKQGVTILGVTGTASGGGTPVLQTKTVKSSTEQDETYTPETGYDGFSSVTVQKFNLQTKTINPGTSDKTVTPSSGYDGFSQVTVKGVPLQTDKTVTLTSAIETIRPDTGYTAMTSVGVTAPLQDITITPQDHQQSIIPPSSGSGYIGYGNITVSAAKLQSKSATPQRFPQTIQPDVSEDYIGLSYVTIAGDSDLQAENIKKDVEIFGVTGTYEPNLQSNKTVSPTTLSQIVTADSNYDGLQQVTVNGDANLVASNIVNGVTIFGVTGTASGSAPVLQQKTVTPAYQPQVVRADNNYDGLEQVTVNGDTNLVASNIVSGTTIFGVTGSYTPNLQSNKNVTPTTSQQIIEPDSDYDGLAQVTVSAINLGSLQLTMADAGDYIYASDEGYDGFDEVILHSPSLETVTVTPTASTQTITPSSGYDAINEVTVSGDSNLVASNIVSGTTIFGVTGTYTPNLQSKTVTLSSTQQTITADTAQGYDGLSSVIVPAIPAVNLQQKTATLGSSQQTITADSGYDGLSSVIVPNSSLQNKTVTLTSSQQVITADNGYYGLGQVTVPAESGGGTDNLATLLFGTSVQVSVSSATSLTSCQGFSGLRALTLPNATEISIRAFQNLYTTNQFTVTAPWVDYIGVGAFKNTKISTLTIGTAGEEPGNFASIGSDAFNGCSNLKNIYILWEGYTIMLDDTNAFTGVVNLTVHVPAALISDYQNETNWSTLYAGRQITFVAL